MGYFSSWHKPIIISKFSLPIGMVSLGIIGYGISPDALDKYLFSDYHVHPTHYVMASYTSNYASMAAGTTTSGVDNWKQLPI